MKPLFVAIEGIDGSGKSTVARVLADWLQSAGRTVHTSRLVTETIRLFKSNVDVESGVAGSYQSLIPDSARGALYLVESYVTLMHLSRRADLDVVLFDRWFPIVDYPLGHRSAWVLGEPVTRLVAREIGDPDLVIWLDVAPALAAKRLIDDQDWMASFYNEKDLLNVLEGLHTKHNERWSACPNLVKLDGAMPVDRLAQLITAAITERLATRRG